MLTLHTLPCGTKCGTWLDRFAAFAALGFGDAIEDVSAFAAAGFVVGLRLEDEMVGDNRKYTTKEQKREYRDRKHNYIVRNL